MWQKIDSTIMPKIIELYNKGFTCDAIAGMLPDCKVSGSTIWRNLNKQGLIVNRRPSGENHPNWKGGRKKTSWGYVLVLNPNHERAQSLGKNKDSRYVLEHILVWEHVHNQKLPKNWSIHHLNGIKDDNRPENLVALPNRKHAHVLSEKAKRIRELEAKVKILERALDANQLMFNVSEN